MNNLNINTEDKEFNKYIKDINIIKDNLKNKASIDNIYDGDIKSIKDIEITYLIHLVEIDEIDDIISNYYNNFINKNYTLKEIASEIIEDIEGIDNMSKMYAN